VIRQDSGKIPRDVLDYYNRRQSIGQARKQESQCLDAACRGSNQDYSSGREFTGAD
jgi:hypothetical protein